MEKRKKTEEAKYNCITRLESDQKLHYLHCRFKLSKFAPRSSRWKFRLLKQCKYMDRVKVFSTNMHMFNQTNEV